MKKLELEQLFIAYCKAAGLINERSRHEYPGKGINSKYIVAKPGTVFLTQSDARAGSNWGIMVNGENGTVSTLYGYVSKDRMFGYLEGAITSNDRNKTKQLLKWAQCLLSDIDAKAIQYEDGTTYDDNTVGDLVADIREAKKALNIE